MSTQQQMNHAHLDTQAFALMSRLHVILRRECGRITDIEYMRLDAAYCRHVLDIAERMPNDSLPALCTRLRNIFFGEEGLFVVPPPKPPLVARMTANGTPPSTTPSPSASAGATTPGPADASIGKLPPTLVSAAVEQAYVGRLR